MSTTTLPMDEDLGIDKAQSCKLLAQVVKVACETRKKGDGWKRVKDFARLGLDKSG